MSDSIVHRAVQWRRRLRLPVAKLIASRSAWFRLVRQCQADVAESSPKVHYTKYRRQELAYWYHVPVWLDELQKARTPVARVLDIGGAYGTLALYCRRLFACEVFVTDFVDSYFASRLTDEFGIEFCVNNIETEDLPWPHRFDVILLTEVLEHFNFRPQQTLERIRDLLTDNGRLFLTTPDAKEWGRVTTHYDSLLAIPAATPGLQSIDGHIWQYSKQELMELVRATGFEIERFGYSPARKRHFNLQLRKAAGPREH